MEGKLVIAGIDVHKKMLAVVLVDADHPPYGSYRLTAPTAEIRVF